MLCDKIAWSLALPNVSTTTTSAALLCVCTARVVKVTAVFNRHAAFRKWSYCWLGNCATRSLCFCGSQLSCCQPVVGSQLLAISCHVAASCHALLTCGRAVLKHETWWLCTHRVWLSHVSSHCALCSKLVYLQSTCYFHGLPERSLASSIVRARWRNSFRLPHWKQLCCTCHERWERWLTIAKDRAFRSKNG